MAVVYCFVSEADSVAGPRIVQALTPDGRQSHLFYPPYRAPLDAIPRELCQLLTYLLGGRRYLVVPNGQGVIDQSVTYSASDDPVGVACRALGRKRISLWIASYPNAKRVLGHVKNVYPRWGYRLVHYLLEQGPDWHIFRPENLDQFPYYLEWCVRSAPDRFRRYAHYIHQPPAWYLELFQSVRPRKRHYPKDRRWNPYYLPAPKTLAPEVAARLQPLEE